MTDNRLSLDEERVIRDVAAELGRLGFVGFVFGSDPEEIGYLQTGNAYADVWEWNGANWSKLAQNG